MMDKYVGKRLDGRYEIQEIIGVGGMAVVYKAYDSIDDRVVAIKILKDELLNNEEFRRRFKNESKAIAVLSHPNIVKVYDVSFGDRLQYIVMEYIDGITLKEYIEQQKVIRWKEAVHFVEQVLRALQHAHDKGIVHRDIKPQNIMLLQDGTIMVTDFGIARFSRSDYRTITDKAIGSVHYVSPEQARGDVTDEKTDIYSVGVLLYEMLTGRLPFEGDSAVSVAIMQLQNEPPRPREINPDIPEGLEQITLKAMQKEPARRYQSAAEMLTDIEEFKRNPSIEFQYRYFIDDAPTKFIGREDISSTSTLSADTAEEEEEEENVRSPLMPILLGVTGAFVLVLIILGIIFLPRLFGDTGEVLECPNLLGKVYDEVITSDEYKDFTITLSNQGQDYSSEYPAGQIMAQTPEAGRSLKGRHEIRVTVSLGPKKVQLDDLTNYNINTAKETLDSLKLNYEVEEVYSDEVAQGFVVRTDPAGGSSLDEGTTVKLYVSIGPAPTFVMVDSYRGLTEEEAKRAIEESGLRVGNVTRQEDSTVPEGVVISQSLTAGTTANKDTAVDLVISSGKPIVDVNLSLPLPNTENSFIISVYYNGQSIYTSGRIDPTSLSNGTVTIPLTADMFVPQNLEPTITVRLDNYNYKEYRLNFNTGRATQTASFDLPASFLESSSVAPPSSQAPTSSSPEPSESSTPSEPDDTSSIASSSSSTTSSEQRDDD